MEYFGEIIALGIDTVLFGICCRYYIKRCTAIKDVLNAPVLELNSELEEVVKAQADQKFPYVAIRGSVKAIGNPITSTNNPNITGTVQKFSIKEHVVTRSSAGFWADQERSIQEVYNSVPFVLQSAEASVEVLDPLTSDILDLETISDRFEPSHPSAFDHLWGFFSGVRQRGVQTTEEMLREGAFITGIGELAAADRTGNLKLQVPSNGASFYLTVLSIPSLVRKLDDQKRMYRFLTLIFGGVGLIICGIMTRRWWKERERKLHEQLAQQRLEATRKERRSRVRDTNLPESQLCVVCRLNPREIILLPCGHVCICEDCSEGIGQHCPVCRAEVETKTAAYIS